MGGFGSLLNGGKLVIIPKEIARNTNQFLELISSQKVTVLNQTPSAFYNLSDTIINFPQELFVRYVIFGGEALTPARLNTWNNSFPECKLINMFGITETTIHVTYKEIRSEEIEQNLSNIGKPIPSLSVYILDEYQTPLPIGVKGEVCVCGSGVCRGYLGNEKLTNEKFIEHPFNKGEKLYRSGDSAYFNTCGDLIYCGRIDNQVKIRGYRIELGEIENVLNNQKDISSSVILVKEDITGNKRLVAYYVVFDKENDQELMK